MLYLPPFSDPSHFSQEKRVILTTDGPNAQLITDEAASADYIRDFALKIFYAADDEDRTGLATRSLLSRLSEALF